MSTGPQHLLLIGTAILGKQFHRSREPALTFTEDIGWRVGITNMFGRFKRRLCALLVSRKPTIGKFFPTFERANRNGR